MINFSTGEETLNATPKELKELGITPIVPSDDKVADRKLQEKYEELITANRDNLSKYTLGDAMNQVFDATKMPNNSDFALYAETLKNIRIAKKDNVDFIELSKEDIEKLKKLFTTPPETPQLNRVFAFILECLDRSHAEALAA